MKSKPKVIDMDPSIPDHEEPKRKKGQKLLTDGHSREAIQDRLGVGRPTNEASMIPELPFDSSLEFSLRGVGGKRGGVEYARIAAEGDVRFAKIVFAYDQLSQSDKERVRLEDLCRAAEISPSDFLGGIVAAASRRNMDVSRLIAASAQSRVTQATIEAALQPFGTDDRKILHTHTGFLPSPKSPSITLTQQTLVSAQGTVQGGGMPKFESDITEVTEAIRGDASTNRRKEDEILDGDP